MEEKVFGNCPFCGGHLKFFNSCFVDNVNYPNEPKILLDITYICENNDVVSKYLISGKSCCVLEHKFLELGKEINFF